MFINDFFAELQLRDLRHENMNPFVGFFVDAQRPSIIMEYCNRGSLEVSYYILRSVWLCDTAVFQTDISQFRVEIMSF